jgi:SAM-dependent methyltransferase
MDSRSNTEFSHEVISHLRTELAASDPWRLDSSPFEQLRHAVILEMVRKASGRSTCLEVGPASGALTIYLRDIVSQLWLIDAMPVALAKTMRRLGSDADVVTLCGSISKARLPPHFFDIVVLSEVLYYLRTSRAVTAAISNCVRALKPSGILVFGSASDHVVRRWGHKYGAESCLRILEQKCLRVESAQVVGFTADEHALISLLSPSGVNPGPRSNISAAQLPCKRHNSSRTEWSSPHTGEHSIFRLTK